MIRTTQAFGMIFFLMKSGWMLGVGCSFRHSVLDVHKAYLLRMNTKGGYEHRGLAQLHGSVDDGWL